MTRPLLAAFALAAALLCFACGGGGGGGAAPAAPAAAVIADVVPASGTAGTQVILAGSGLTGTTRVTFAGNASAAIEAISDIQINVTVPAGAISGPITITTPAGPVVSAVRFQIVPPSNPAASQYAFKPASGPVGTVVTITGSGMDQVSAVTIGGVQAEIKAAAANYLQILVPGGTNGGVIQLTTPAGVAAPAQAFEVTTEPAPAILYFFPPSGPPGSSMTVFGSNLEKASASFGAVPAAIDSVSTYGVWISLVVPASLPPGPATLNLSAAGVAIAAPTPFQVTGAAAVPVITGMDPLSGPPGTVVNLTGSGFSSVYSASFGGGAAATVLSGATDSLLQLTVPPDAASGTIRIWNLSGAAPSPQSFQVLGAPPAALTLSSISPDSARPNSYVYVFGSGLAGATRISFGGVPARLPVRVVADFQLEAIVPPDAQSGPISVTGATGSVDSSFRFTLDPTPGPPPVLRFVSPPRGAPGTSVTLSGAGLAGVRSVSIGGAPASFSFAYNGQLKVTVPSGLPAGQAEITAATAWGTQSTLTGQFTVISAGTGTPAIDRFTPDSGRATSIVTIHGSNLATVNQAAIGGIDCSESIFIWDDSLLLLKVPAGTPGPASISLTSPNGTVSTPGTPFTLTVPPPVISDIFPFGGPEGTPVVIQGGFLDNLKSVRFGAIPAPAVSDASIEGLTVLVPLGAASAPITITTAGGSVSSPTPFTVMGAVGTLGVRIAAMYLTQGTQRKIGSVPLVAGRNGFLRVFVQANQKVQAQPKVRVTLRDAGGNPVLTEIINAPGPAIPTSLQEGDLSQSWNMAIPGGLIQPGSTVLAELLPGPEFPALDPVGLSFPPNGAPMPLDVRVAPPLGITLLPVQSGGRLGNVNLGGRTPDAWADRIRRIYPVSVIDVQVAPPFATTTNLGPGADIRAYADVRDQIEAKRLADAPNNLRYYCGAFNFSPGDKLLGLADFGKRGSNLARSCLVADVEGRDDGENFPEILAHEIGHNLGRRHAPCGGAAGPDLDYPYADGLIGAQGLDVAAAKPIDPQRTTDIMGYCSPGWVSDYNYKAILDFRSGDLAPAAQASSAPQQALLVRGNLRNGVLTLLPAFEVPGVSTPPAPGGYTLQCLDAAGKVLGSVSFEPQAIEDLPAGEDYRSFAFTIPMTPGLQDGLAALRVTGGGLSASLASGAPGRPSPASAQAGTVRQPVAMAWNPGVVHLGWDHGTHRQVMIRDPRTGLIIGMGENGSIDLATDATDLELILSDGVRSLRKQIHVQQ